MKPPCKTGDRIRLTKMDNDPNPIPVGTEGIVLAMTPPINDQCYIMVDWEINRSLTVVWPEDQIEVIV